jgi:hypothetical protein
VESLSPTIRLVLQPDRRQQPDRRLVWRGGRRTSDAQGVSNRQSGDWQDREDDLADEDLTSPIYVLS